MLWGGSLIDNIEKKSRNMWLVGQPPVECILAFTRYCHDQYCMVYGLLKGGRGGVVQRAIAVQ